MRPGPQNRRTQAARAIELALFSYANDHGEKYPTGKSSTEVFQQLIDQDYAEDPQIFYFPMPGKIKPLSTMLKPENVCFDVTNGVLPDDPDSIPLVFSTGYRIDYVRGGKAHPLQNGDPGGLAVAFKSNSAAFLSNQPGGVPLFPPAPNDNADSNFDPKGRTYQQLTPDGPLP